MAKAHKGCRAIEEEEMYAGGTLKHVISDVYIYIPIAF
jgi:hypothetical protein